MAIKISKQGLISDNPLDCLKLAYIMNKEKLAETFENIKFQVKDEKDLEIMSKIVKDGHDVNGSFSDPENEKVKIVFDCMRILHNINWTPEERQVAINYNNYTK